MLKKKTLVLQPLTVNVTTKCWTNIEFIVIVNNAGFIFSLLRAKGTIRKDKIARMPHLYQSLGISFFLNWNIFRLCKQLLGVWVKKMKNDTLFNLNGKVVNDKVYNMKIKSNYHSTSQRIEKERWRQYEKCNFVYLPSWDDMIKRVRERNMKNYN